MLDPFTNFRRILNNLFLFALAFVLFVLVTSLVTGCATLAAKTPGTCDDVLAAEAKGCQFVGSQLFVEERGLGLSFAFLCGATTKFVGMSDSQAMHDAVVAEGATDLGECLRGTKLWYTLRIEKRTPTDEKSASHR
jgi:hypothetical protein